MKKDKIDEDIIELLQANGRTSNKEIADRLSISEGTVRNRIKKLCDENYLKVKGLINPDSSRENQLLFLGAKVALSRDLQKTAKAVTKLPYVRSVSVVSGRYDLLIEIFLPQHKLISFISGQLSKVDSIVSTESFLAMECINKWI